MKVRPAEHTPEAVVNDIRHNVGHFVPDPHIQLGDTDSAHRLHMGMLEPYGQVAIKPFGREIKALHEKSMLQAVRERGFETFDPLAVASGSLGVYLITAYRPGLRHLGQVDWNVDIASPQLSRVIIPTLHTVGNFLAGLHRAEVTHGDFQVRNAVYDRLGKPVVVDLEKGQIQTNHSRDHRRKSKDADIQLFGQSVLDRGLLLDRSANYRARFLGEEFVTPAQEASSGTDSSEELERRKSEIQAKWMAGLRRDHGTPWMKQQLKDAAQKRRHSN
ncbi:MAG TPA: lipopolysaccharide kinase InaA family protein [Candidatus Saccharimonadales bacterium]|nr:lipopolysaccharide kinase InaA family protein [Candidatus Saccharimonadales bacterium]